MTEEDLRCFDLFMQGLTLRDISKVVGVSYQRVQQRLDRIPAYHEYRVQQREKKNQGLEHAAVEWTAGAKLSDAARAHGCYPSELSRYLHQRPDYEELLAARPAMARRRNPERVTRAQELYKQGIAYDAIGDELGIKGKWVRQRVYNLLKLHPNFKQDRQHRNDK